MANKTHLFIITTLILLSPILTINFIINNKCNADIVVFFDRAKPPCDKEGIKVPFGECTGGNVEGKGWWDSRNGNIPNQKLIKPGDSWQIPIPVNSQTSDLEWCFDEAGRRVCSGNGGWIGYDCYLDGSFYKCKSGSDNGFPYWPNRFEPNFNPLKEVIFYNLSGVDGVNVNMKMTSLGTCDEKDKSTVCNVNLAQCPYPDHENQTCESQCQACNRIVSGKYPSYWDKNDFTDPSTGQFVNCSFLCAAGAICQDKFHLDCAQRVEGNTQECCKSGQCSGATCQFPPVKASKKWCDFIHGKDGGRCDIYCWAYDDGMGTRACGKDGDLLLDVTCSVTEDSENKLGSFLKYIS